MLEHLGLRVDAVPRHAELLGEVQLEQPVMADDLERQAEAGRRELHAAVGLVAHETHLVEPLDHPEAEAAVTPRRSASAFVDGAVPRRCRA